MYIYIIGYVEEPNFKIVKMCLIILAMETNHRPVERKIRLQEIN